MKRVVLSVVAILLSLGRFGECQNLPQITKVILPTIRRAGETGKLNCTVTNQLDNKVYWIEQRSQRVISGDDAIDVEDAFNPVIDGFPKYQIERSSHNDQTTYQLIIRRLQLTDAGVYVCQVQIKGLSVESPSKNGEMIVLLPPNIVQRETTQTLTVGEGANVTLKCKAEGYPPPFIKWVRPNGMALPLPGLPFSIQSEVLQLTSVTMEDRGMYRCIADNDVRPADKYDSTLYIQFKPFAKPVQTSYGQAQNRMFDITLVCRIAGTPEPDLRWYQIEGEDGMVPITNDDRHLIHILNPHDNQLSISEYWFQLTIINVQANDYGFFYCEGTNSLGAGGARVLLYETSECQGPNCPEEGRPSGSGVAMVTSSILITMATVICASYQNL